MTTELIATRYTNALYVERVSTLTGETIESWYIDGDAAIREALAAMPRGIDLVTLDYPCPIPIDRPTPTKGGM